ncbi:MAG: M20/M25/M40 family metallo-hydrolase [Proteobacteria bacterium]|nr:M20/M25/M40 family metallo-hydrolase [Pseudomonadota bacterium]
MNKERLITTFCELVKIPSETPNDKEFISYLEKLFKKEGAQTQLDSYGNLVAKFAARNSSTKEPIAFCCHADTVKPGIGIEPVIENGIIKSKGETILGADDKAGIAILIEMIKSSAKHPPLEFIITRCEEIGTEGSSNLDYSLIKSKIAYVLDEENIEDIIVGAPTKLAFIVEYRGKSAHASEPENGVSSILAAAKAIASMKLGRLDEESTANVGVIEGGEVVNGIPEKTKIIAECRSCNHNKALKIAKEMETIFRNSAREVGTSIDIKSEIKYEAFRIPEDSKVVQLAVKALKKYDIKANTLVITGGLDANNFNKHGIQTATLGVGCRDIHTTKEYLLIKDLETSARTVIDIVEGLA